MTTPLTDQTRADLENLLAEQDNGWCAYKYATMGETSVKIGKGGCLVEQMRRLLNAQGIWGAKATRAEYSARQDAMIEALGFIETIRGVRKGADILAMFAWNDAQRDPDAIRARIKDALNG
jgi:hypothetical protein